ncbi:MAG TPA: SDR family oxidoreductase [Actinomycetota bacterium]|jgi:NAD(P)-dependent dehydrogenase (short-subunit alcohol dehydrogenase family)|nr:SDR family oxidoreductase [Actinomycetota bacterium]
MDLGIDGRRALVTGGSRGIGRAIARALAAEGARVAICARTREPLEAAAASIASETGAEVRAIVADVRDRAAVESLVRDAAERFGGLEIVVNSAARVSGAAVPEDLERVAEETVLGDFEEKVLGSLRTTRAALPHLRRAGWGRIVNVSGLTARVAGSVSAGARNAALVHLTRTMSVALGRDGITANAVYPALTVTESLEDRLAARAEREGTTRDRLLADLSKHSAIGRLVTAGEIADVVTFLASERAAGITGEAIAVSGGTGSSVSY